MKPTRAEIEAVEEIRSSSKEKGTYIFCDDVEVIQKVIQEKSAWERVSEGAQYGAGFVTIVGIVLLLIDMAFK